MTGEKIKPSKKLHIQASMFKNKGLKADTTRKASTLNKEKQSQTPADQNKDLNDKILEKNKQDSVHKKLKQALEDNLYLRAEFENFKRRSLEEKSQLIRYSGKEFISALADEVLDDLDRAVLSSIEKKSYEDLQKGLKMIHKKLSQVFTRFGVEVLDPLGQVFDPSYQSALSSIKTSKIPENHVAETFKKAYKLHGKVIRPAQVVLAKKEK